jgi:hypothetical protein
MEAPDQRSIGVGIALTKPCEEGGVVEYSLTYHAQASWLR